MKSLEIVNEMVDYWESAVNVACQSNAENGYYDELDIVEYQNRLKKYQQIKADLEILEILKKLFGDMEIDIWHSKRFHKTIGEIRFSGTDFAIDVEDFGITLENLQKLKQWLEENEDGSNK